MPTFADETAELLLLVITEEELSVTLAAIPTAGTGALVTCEL